MDEYTSEIMMGGHNTLVIHNTCEDSLLASPIILDLVILAEVCQRITFRAPNQTTYQPFHSVLSLLSYLCKVSFQQPSPNNRERRRLNRKIIKWAMRF